MSKQTPPVRRSSRSAGIVGPGGPSDKGNRVETRTTGHKTANKAAGGGRGNNAGRSASERGSAGPTTQTVQISPRALAIGGGAVLLLVLAAFLLLSNLNRSGATQAGSLSPVSTVQGADYHSLAVSPTDSDRVWFGSHSGIQESADGGKTWHPVASVSGDAMSLAMPQADPSRVYIAGHDIFKRSTDSGTTWQDIQTNLPGTDLHGFAADPSDAKHLFALVAGQGVFESRDSGSAWQAMPTQPPGAYGALAVNGGSPATLYVATSLGLMRSQDDGASWHRKDAGLPEGQAGVRALLPVPNKPQEWYAATGDGLYSSANEGVSWQRTALEGQNLAALAASNAGALRLYVLTTEGAVYRLEGATLPR